MFSILSKAALVAAVAAANTGTSRNDPCEADCSSGTCVFTTKLNVFASSTGYYQFEECGDTVQPVLKMKQNTEYKFIQADNTNWLHPLGFAYYPDGAHNGVDELELEIVPPTSTSNCDSTATCQAPLYYLGDQYLGGGSGDGGFGLDLYEPGFQIPRDQWIDAGGGEYNIRLTISDTQYTKDIFYFCHIHHGMSGRIVIADAGGNLIESQDEPPLYDFQVPGAFDTQCGTYGLDEFSYDNTCPSIDSGKFLCAPKGSHSLELFGECLHAMDCAMHEDMRVDLHESDAIITFMHQMIPHHENAVNMAKLILKTVDLNTYTGDTEDLENLMWDIISGQNAQIGYMQNFLRDNNYESVDEAQCNLGMGMGMGMGGGMGKKSKLSATMGSEGFQTGVSYGVVGSVAFLVVASALYTIRSRYIKKTSEYTPLVDGVVDRSLIA